MKPNTLLTALVIRHAELSRVAQAMTAFAAMFGTWTTVYFAQSAEADGSGPGVEYPPRAAIATMRAELQAARPYRDPNVLAAGADLDAIEAHVESMIATEVQRRTTLIPKLRRALTRTP